MIEFGSDFHRCEQKFISNTNEYLERLRNIRYFASGRQALEAIIKQEKWYRIWIPAYFCYEVIQYISSLGITVQLYDDNPLLIDEDKLLSSLNYEKGDVLLRINFFGLRKKRSNKNIPVPIIEDHTHDIISEWAINSDADWCIASVRKSLPVAAGGILWSPKNKSLPKQIASTPECEKMAEIRYEAMTLKSHYLYKEGDKNIFREKYLASEDMIENLSLSGMDTKTYELLQKIDIKHWTNVRIRNCEVAYNLLSNKFKILKRQTTETINQFSLILLCESNEERDSLRQFLIKNSIYPAILWSLPNNSDFTSALNFSQNMLSIHCDGRYEVEEIKHMCNIINSYYD